MAKDTTKQNATQKTDNDAVQIPPINRSYVSFRIKGTSPLIQHKFSEKAKEMMRQKHAGKKTRSREARDPEAEALAATYFTKDKKYAIPAMGLKKSILTAAHKDIGTPRSLVKKAIFLHNVDADLLMEMDCSDPVHQEDPVTVGTSTDLRYRPYFYEWSVAVTFEIDLDLLQVDDLLNLVDRAGFGVGICEWRPERDGEFGRFEVDRSSQIKQDAA